MKQVYRILKCILLNMGNVMIPFSLYKLGYIAIRRHYSTVCLYQTLRHLVTFLTKKWKIPMVCIAKSFTRDHSYHLQITLGIQVTVRRAVKRLSRPLMT